MVYTQTGTTGRFYVDGVLDSVVAYAPSQSLSLNNDTIGGMLRTSAEYWFTGLIDDVALWNRPLTAGEVQMIYATGPDALLGVTLASPPYYVAPAPVGDDSQPGTSSSPFATLEKARDTIRAYKSQHTNSLGGGATVYLKGGLHKRTQTFELTAQDGGTRAEPIVYAAAPGESPRLVGAVLLTNTSFQCLGNVANDPIKSRLTSYVWNTWRTSLGTNFDPGPIMTWNSDGSRPTVARSELFMNGERLPLSRWPNQDEFNPDAFVKAGLTQFNPAWAAPQSSNIWAIGAQGWVWQQVNKKIPIPDAVSDLPSLGCYFYNILEELDTPGEFYIDINNQPVRLYFMPITAQTTTQYLDSWNEVLLSTLRDPVIKLNGSAFVTFQGLSVEATRGDGIEIYGGDHNSISNCTIKNIGRTGIVVDGAATGNAVSGRSHTIVNCVIHDTGADGLAMYGGDKATGQHSGHLVTGCEIFRPGRFTLKANSRAFKCDGVGHTFSNNEVHDSVDIGVSLAGYHNIYDANECYDLAQRKNDAAALYGGTSPTWGTAGNIIRNNYIHNISGYPGNFVAAIYADCDSTGGFIIGNVCAHIGSSGNAGTGVMINGGRMNNLSGNLFIGLDRAMAIGRGSDSPYDNKGWMVDPYLNLVFPSNSLNPLFEKYPNAGEQGAFISTNPYVASSSTVKAAWDSAMTVAKYNYVLGNAYVGCRNTEGFSSETLSLNNNSTIKFLLETNNYAYADTVSAGIPGAMAGDYSLAPTSAIFSNIPAFKTIPFTQIGRQGSSDPLYLPFADFDMSGGNYIPAMEDQVLCGKLGVIKSGVNSPARKEFRGATAIYSLAVRYKDASGGQPTVTLSIGGNQVDSWILNQDDNSWNNRVIQSVQVKTRDELLIQCSAAGTDAGCVESISLTALAMATIITQPVPQVAQAGAQATFTISAAGVPAPTYQWLKNAVVITNATASSYTTPALSLNDDMTLYSCQVSNLVGSVTSSAAAVMVVSPPCITGQPVAQSVAVGQTAVFYVTASSRPSPSYQWQKNGAVLPGATNAGYTTLPLTAADNGAVFRCVVSNSLGSVTSSNAPVLLSGETFAAWSQRIFGSLVSRTDDPDGDGMDNYHEYLAGTNPLDPQSKFIINSVATTGTAGTTVTWNSVVGNLYAVEYSTDLKTWTPLQGNIAGTGGVLAFTDLDAASRPKAFYRVATDASQ